MKKHDKTTKIYWIIFAVVVFLFCQAVTSFAGDGKIEISQTPSTTFPIVLDGSQGNSYILTSDINATYNAIEITADNITLDLMGFSIIGPDSAPAPAGMGVGVFICASNVEIRNGTIRDFASHGIGNESNGNVCSNTNIKIVNIRAINNGGYGITIGNGSEHIVKDSIATNNQYGIRINSGSLIGNVTSNNAGYGMLCYANCVVTKNTSNNNGSDGIYAVVSSTIIGNVANFNGGIGIRTSKGLVSQNIANNNGNTGILAGSSSTIINNTTIENGLSGIYVPTNATVIGNTSNNNGEHGIYAMGLISGNVTSYNGQNGIAGASGGSTVTNNRATYNQFFGIVSVSSVIDGNTALYNNQSGGSYTNINGNGIFGTNYDALY